MDFKWKLSALYINLYIKIALHLKTKRSMILIVKKMKDSEWHAKCCMFESLLCFLNEVPSWLNQEHCALLFPLSHSPTAGIINREIRLLWNIFHILFVKHELVVKDHETMHKCFWGGGGYEGLWPDLLLIYCRGFWYPMCFYFILKGVAREVIHV